MTSPTPRWNAESDNLADLLAALSAALEPGAVCHGEAVSSRHWRDWSGAPAERPVAILMPRSPTQVALALQVCHQRHRRVAVQGGLTGLVGGANPHSGEVVLSLERLNAIEEIDEAGGTVVVQAGVTLEQLQTAVQARDWTFPLDLGARGSCHIGGNAATNAGGNRVLRHGMMRQLVLGLEVALADGRVLTMLDRVIKNNAGFDLKQLFIGSEGSLGVITRLSLKLEPLLGASCTALCAVSNLAAATRLLRTVRRSLRGLCAFELMWPGYVDASAQALGRARPFPGVAPLCVLIETAGVDQDICRAEMEALLSDGLEAGELDDAIVAQSLDQAQGLWELREGVTELLSRLRPCAAFDVSVAMPSLESLVSELESRLAADFPHSAHLFFGHLGDGNLHLISGPYVDPAAMHAVEDIVYGCVGRHDGSISAEHGIGVVKRDHLHHSRSAPEIALMRELKALLDPRRILNAGRVVA
jgi:FAD/FMN-containing dehydrogenase